MTMYEVAYYATVKSNAYKTAHIRAISIDQAIERCKEYYTASSIKYAHTVEYVDL